MIEGLENIELLVVGLRGYTFWEARSPLQLVQQFGTAIKYRPNPKEPGYGFIVGTGTKQVHAAARKTDRANKWRGHQ